MLRARHWQRFHLVGLVVGILLVGFIATNAVSYLNASRILKATILHNELPLTGSNIYSEVQADLIRPVFISSVMAHDTFVKDWLLAGEPDRDSITRYLDAIRQTYGVFTSFLVSNKSLEYYHFQGGKRTIDPAHNPDDVWFGRVRNMTAPYEINIDYDQSSGRTVTIFVNYRVIGYHGEFLGVTGVGLNIDTVQRIVGRYHNDFHRNVYFVARSGDIALSSAAPGDPMATGANIHKVDGMAQIAGQMLGAAEGQFEYRRGGEAYLMDTRFIPELGWQVIVEQRQADVVRGLWSGFLTNLGIGSLIILATAGVVGWTIVRYQRRLEVMATTDKLTGLRNRAVFDSEMQHLLDQRRRGTQQFSVLLFDIDHFKRINDTLGHLRGDEVIRRVALRTGAVLRTTDLVCRWGGEELLILARECGAAGALAMAETLRAAIEAEPLLEPDDGTRVTISIGVTTDQPGDSTDAILARADAALYRAKREGRNCVRISAAESPA